MFCFALLLPSRNAIGNRTLVYRMQGGRSNYYRIRAGPAPLPSLLMMNKFRMI